MMPKKEIKTYYRRNLPHIQPIGQTFFVTFRLKNSIPKIKLLELKEIYDKRINQIMLSEAKFKKELIYDEHKRFFAAYDNLLDKCKSGPTYLKNPAIADLVKHELHRFDQKLYDLLAYSIMPNHVHILIDTAIQIPVDLSDKNWESLNLKPLDVIMKRIKGPCAIAINRLLNRKGKLWQKESYDHYIRNAKELNNIVSYILNNPIKAKLASNWEEHPFTWVKL